MSAKAYSGRLAQAVGARVREIRQAKGLTQRELAARIGVPGFERTHLTRIERGLHLVDIHTCNRVAQALGLDLAGLLSCIDGIVP
jgi:transcriptional regulator with XRE-family HTH domain